jgi:hypothetical protein
MTEVVADGAGIEGEDQKHHERSLQSRATVGVDNLQPHHARASERQALADSDSSHARSTQGFSRSLSGIDFGGQKKCGIR